MEKGIFRIAAVIVVAVFVVVPILAGAEGTNKITICHATNSVKNPYVEIKVSQSALNGHEYHTNDVIPAPVSGCPSSAPGQNQPTLDFSAALIKVLPGNYDILTWTSTNTVSCTASSDLDSANWSGNKPTSGTATVYPEGPATTYSINCLGTDSSTISGSIIVTVTAPV